MKELVLGIGSCLMHVAESNMLDHNIHQMYRLFSRFHLVRLAKGFSWFLVLQTYIPIGVT